MGTYELVAVGTDGSASADHAVGRAAEMAADVGASLLIVCAYRQEDRDTVHEATEAIGEDAFNVVGASPAEEKLARARDSLRDVGVPSVDTLAVEGDPVDVLVRTAEDRAADLMVVGNRGLNSLAGRLLGSVPSGVSRRSATDVLIVHTTS